MFPFLSSREMRRLPRPGFVASVGHWFLERKVLSLGLVFGTVITVQGFWHIFAPKRYGFSYVMRDHPEYKPPSDE